jgi:hypothetical protein
MLQYVLSLGSLTVNYYADNNPVTFNTDLQLYEKATPTSTQFSAKTKSFKLIKLRTAIICSLSIDDNKP